MSCAKYTVDVSVWWISHIVLNPHHTGTSLDFHCMFYLSFFVPFVHRGFPHNLLYCKILFCVNKRFLFCVLCNVHIIVPFCVMLFFRFAFELQKRKKFSYQENPCQFLFWLTKLLFTKLWKLISTLCIFQ